MDFCTLSRRSLQGRLSEIVGSVRQRRVGQVRRRYQLSIEFGIPQTAVVLRALSQPCPSGRSRELTTATRALSALPDSLVPEEHADGRGTVEPRLVILEAAHKMNPSQQLLQQERSTYDLYH